MQMCLGRSCLLDLTFWLRFLISLHKVVDIGARIRHSTVKVRLRVRFRLVPVSIAIRRVHLEDGVSIAFDRPLLRLLRLSPQGETRKRKDEHGHDGECVAPRKVVVGRVLNPVSTETLAAEDGDGRKHEEC